MFDYFSVVDRKNPVGLIEAFRKAFAPSEGPTLVIKSINGDGRMLDRERVRFAAAGRPDIVLIERYMSPRERDALLDAADCYVSLHRSEGFGLTLAESMALGKPVIATGYSGNVDFMTEKNSYLVPFDFDAVPSGCEPYPAGLRWASPDLKAAAALLRRIWQQPEEAAAKGRLAAEDIGRRHSLAACSEFVEARFAAIQGRRSQGIQGIMHTERPSAARRILAAVRSTPQRSPVPPVV
jgi:glycosyltransferase involved in cell wall biosynthesis